MNDLHHIQTLSGRLFYGLSDSGTVSASILERRTTEDAKTGETQMTKTWKLDNAKCYKLGYAVQAALRITEKLPERLWVLVLSEGVQIRIQSGHIIDGRRYLEFADKTSTVVKAFAYIVKQPITTMDAYRQGEGR